MNSKHSMKHGMQALLLLAALAHCMGCGPGRTAIEGTVAVDGVPVDEGIISFVPVEHDGVPVATTNIVDGQFSFNVSEGPLVGRNSVVVTGGKRTGRQIENPPDEFHPQGETVNEIEDLVPAKYREVNILVVDVTSSGEKIELNLDAE